MPQRRLPPFVSSGLEFMIQLFRLCTVLSHSHQEGHEFVFKFGDSMWSKVSMAFPWRHRLNLSGIHDRLLPSRHHPQRLSWQCQQTAIPQTGYLLAYLGQKAKEYTSSARLL